jgi:hypothetical protein
VVLDADVIYPSFLRDVLLRLAGATLLRPRWTERIHGEWIRNVVANYPDRPPHVDRIRAHMEAAFPDALVTGYEGLEARFPEVSPKDRHVAAAALRAGAAIILTRNLRHFPEADLAPHGITSRHPDDFVCDLLAEDKETTARVLENHRVRLKDPGQTRAQYQEALRRSDLKRAADLLW